MNQLTEQQTPDAGQSDFYYDSFGQLRLSQNAQQVLDGQYSYTKYDQQGRTTEVGELSTTEAIASLQSKLNEASFPATSTYALSDITRTYYDSVDSRVQDDFVQTNVRNRVAWTEVLDAGQDTLTTHYAYDAHGNVKSLLQQVPGLDSKRTDYVYDLVSGNVRFVFYQFDSADQFCQEYRYDADNRLTEVHTSTDRHFWNKEAHYRYYPHGPLARIELGEYRVQGLDYYYTLQGWLKGVNGTNDSNDPGGDGLNGSVVGKDAFAFALGYHEGDYQGIGATPTNNGLWDRLDEQHPGEPGQEAYRGLYNGNIAWMQTNLPGLKQQGIDPQQAMLYQYDQLNRLVQAQSLRNFSETNGFAARTATPEGFDANYAYDANGNLLTLQRHNAQAALQDDFTYQYAAGTNKLTSLIETVPPETVTYEDITYNSSPLNSDGKVYRTITVQDDVVVNAGQSPFLRANQSITLKENFHAQAGSGFHAKWTDEATSPGETIDDNSTFTYDAIGNLIADSGEGTTITWTPYGKPRSVSKTDGTTVNYRYDATGNRVEKQVVTSDSTYSTQYIRDASGNVLAIYENDSLLEQPIYGSSRLGMYSGKTQAGQQQLGHRRYELSSYTNSVLATITDNVNMNADSTWATIVGTQDYFAYGLPSRSWQSNSYRFGWNTQEKADEINANGEHYTAQFWEYDARNVHRWNLDPKPHPAISPYAIMQGNPIMYSDPLGDTIVNNLSDPDRAKAFDLWVNASSAGKKFKNDFGIGGRYQNITVEFNDASANIGGTTESFLVLKNGKRIEISTSNDDKLNKAYNLEELAQGNTIDGNYLKFEVGLGDDYSPNSFPSWGYQTTNMIETLNHEKQHVMINIKTLAQSGRKRSAYYQHQLMKANSLLYQERKDLVLEFKPYWESDLTRWQGGGKLNTEDRFINFMINDYIMQHSTKENDD